MRRADPQPYLQLSQLDLVYSAGLLDYLETPVAARLTESLLSCLAPGGTLLLANFAPDYGTAGYMEAFMDWRLICRDAQGLADLASGVPPTELASLRTYASGNGYIVYLDLVRR